MILALGKTWNMRVVPRSIRGCPPTFLIFFSSIPVKSVRGAFLFFWLDKFPVASQWAHVIAVKDAVPLFPCAAAYACAGVWHKNNIVLTNAQGPFPHPSVFKCDTTSAPPNTPTRSSPSQVDHPGNNHASTSARSKRSTVNCVSSGMELMQRVHSTSPSADLRSRLLLVAMWHPALDGRKQCRLPRVIRGCRSCRLSLCGLCSEDAQELLPRRRRRIHLLVDVFLLFV